MKETFQIVEELKRARVIEDYAVAGAVGALFYVEPFATLDIDFLLDLPSSENLLISLEPIHAWLRMRGYSEFDDQGNIVIEKWPVQFLPVNDALSGEALARAQYLPFDETLNVRVLSPEYLAAESLKVGRPKDLGRISQLTASDEFDSDRFLDLVHRFGLQEKWAKLEPLFDQE
jgi:hypothetical protein